MTVTVIVIFLLSFVILAFRGLKKRNEVLKQTRMMLGFTEVSEREAKLRERVVSVTRNGKKIVAIRRMYKRDDRAYTLFDCQVLSHDGKQHYEYVATLVVPGLELPAFRLAWRQFKSGVFSALGKVIEVGLKKGGFSNVDLPAVPDLSDKYMLTVKSPDQLRADISPDVWREIAAISDYLHIEAEGDIIVFTADPRASGTYTKVEQARIEEAARVGAGLGRIFASLVREMRSSPQI